MPNPIPKRFRRPLKNIVVFVLVYLSGTALLSLLMGKVLFPPIFPIVCFAIGSMIAVWLKGAKGKERV